MNKMLLKSTLSNIFTVICCVVIVIGIVSLIAVIAGIRPFVMISESMHPEVPKESTVTASIYMGKEVLSIPQVGGWIRKALDYKRIVIIAAAGLIIIGCIPKGRKAEPQKAA